MVTQLDEEVCKAGGRDLKLLSLLASHMNDSQHDEDTVYVCGYCAAVVCNLAAHAQSRQELVTHERILPALIEATQHQVGN
jgi:hypothetical protein